ncbi:MAG: branched-chain-amino-acid transaminase [Omnitrophica WOR_2 bacterium RIFCSPHIGHO2_01_FULL_49_10]|nr:MAG: branched-chain-amino-acid transaminase [Omnitrophica WOR_2 bacterium RIFCSPHIGHO2_01_FULL_49_10]OGX32734.1 MAG: branched-chain-amino-acid transaminase [Omnitrophica WOR_2 bacterium RIFCSPLOWO2_02_FULL_50_19]
MGLKIYIDGKFYQKEDAKVSVFDHGLLYGDGVFEGIRTYDGLIFKLKEHIDRLYQSAHAIMLDIPISKDEMVGAIKKTLRENDMKDAYIRLLVTRGIGDLGLDPRKCGRPTVVIITDKIKLYPQELYGKGLEIVTISTQRNIHQAVNPQIKSLNYLNNILAKVEAINAGVEEAVMLNSEGYVAECTGDNIFIVKDGSLLTPPIHSGVLRGITRGAVIDIACLKEIPVHEEVLTRYDLFNSDEMFLTGTAAEIIPVVRMDRRKIGDGKPGKMTLKLIGEFNKLTKVDGVRF